MRYATAGASESFRQLGRTFLLNRKRQFHFIPVPVSPIWDDHPTSRSPSYRRITRFLYGSLAIGVDRRIRKSFNRDGHARSVGNSMVPTSHSLGLVLHPVGYWTTATIALVHHPSGNCEDIRKKSLFFFICIRWLMLWDLCIDFRDVELCGLSY